VYESSALTSAGTMDHSPHLSGSHYKMKVRVQVSGQTLNVQVSQLRAKDFGLTKQLMDHEIGT
jgi:hypothetical protein